MIRFALIGCGKIAEKYSQIFNSLDNAKIVKIFDIKPEKAQHISKLLDSNPEVTNNLDSVLEDIDAAIVATHPSSHFDLMEKIAPKNIHLFVEKPVALNYKQTAKAVKLCKQKGVTLGVNLQYRKAPLLKLIRHLIKKKALGKPIFLNIKVNWLRDKEYYGGWRNNRNLAGGGILISQLIHFIDFSIQIFGKPRKVQCLNKKNELSKKVEDTSIILLDYPKGPTVIISGSNCVFPDANDELCLECTGGTLKSTQLNRGGIIKELTTKNKFKLQGYKPHFDKIENNRLALMDFIEAINSKKKQNHSQDELIMKVIDALYKSARKKKAVIL